MRRIYMLLLLLLAIPLTACATSGEYQTPYQRLGARITASSAVNNQTAIQAQATLACPAGMVAQRGTHVVGVENDTRMSYREESPGRRGGYSTRGSLRDSYATYSSKDVEVEAETETQSRGSIRCVPPIDLTPERR